MRRILVWTMTLALLVWGGVQAEGAPGAEILWDTWGVPHIYAESLEEALYALGWAQMRAHGDVILESFAVGRGRAAELWGEAYAPSDRHVLAMGLRARLDELRGEVGEMPESEAFVAGMNAFAETHPEALDERLARALPLTVDDLLAGEALTVDRGLVEGFRARYLAGGDARRHSLVSAPSAPASNAWAIGPSRSASGNPILLSNTHLGWPNLREVVPDAAVGVVGLLWFEAHIVTPDLDFYGVGPVGAPALVVGFNDDAGWTVTIPSLFDTVDFYELTLVDDGYLFDGEVREFETDSHTLRVRQEDGSYREEEVVARRSVHGPVIAERGDGAVAVRAHEPTAVEAASTQFWDMARATDVDAFLGALEQQPLPIPLNVFYADRSGTIMFTLAGAFPDRPEGDYDWGGGLIPGDTSETLWRGILPFEAMPVVIDPEAGYLQNANEPFYSLTLPIELDPADFPADWPEPQLWPRSQRSLQLITGQDRFSAADVMTLKFDTHSLLADQVLDEVVALGLEHGSSDARDAAALLAAWDRRFDAESVGAVVFAFWAMHYEDDILAGAPFPADAFAVPFDWARPLETPRGVADPVMAVRALEYAAAAVLESFGALEVPWGAFYTFRLGGEALPAFAAPPEGFGLFVPNFAAPTEHGPMATVGGDTWVAVIEFGERARAQAVFSYGNTTDLDSPFFANQLALYAAQAYRPVWRDREDVEANLASREMLRR